MASMSMPPLPLLAILGIVIFLLSISQSRNINEQLENASVNFHLFLFLLPILLISAMLVARRLNFTGGRGGWLDFRAPRAVRQEYQSMQRSGGFPWGVAILVVALLVLVSYQSSFHSKWF